MSIIFKEIDEINFKNYFLRRDYNYTTIEIDYEIIGIKKRKEGKFYNLYEIQ